MQSVSGVHSIYCHCQLEDAATTISFGLFKLCARKVDVLSKSEYAKINWKSVGADRPRTVQISHPEKKVRFDGKVDTSLNQDRKDIEATGNGVRK